MDSPAKEPLFTTRGWIAYGIMSVVYAGILFSMDPEWVGWAGPLAFGGALTAQGPPPASAHLDLSPNVMMTAFAFGVASLLGLVLLAAVRSKPDFDWLAWFRAERKDGAIAKAQSHLRSASGPMHGR